MSKKSLKALFTREQELDKKSTDALIRALEKSNLEGFDYIEFKQSLAALRDLSMDDETAIRSAFATASTMGLTKDKLLETAKYYKQILAREKKQFDAALEKQMKSRVDNKRKELQLLKEEIKEKEAKIAELEKEIAAHRDKLEHADEIIANNRRKLEETNQNFDQTYTSFLKQIDKDIENISKLI